MHKILLYSIFQKKTIIKPPSSYADEFFIKLLVKFTVELSEKNTPIN